MKLLMITQFAMIGFYSYLELGIPALLMSGMLYLTYLYNRYENPRNV